MDSTSYFEDVSKQNWTSVCNIRGLLYWFWKPLCIYFSTNVTYFTKRLLHAICTALATEKLLWTTCAKAKTNLRSEKKKKSSVNFYLPHFSLLCSSRYLPRTAGQCERKALCLSPLVARSKKGASHRAQTQSWDHFGEYVGLEPFSGGSPENNRRKHTSWNAHPCLAAPRSSVALNRQPNFWDLIPVTEVSRNDLLDEVHL